MEKAFEIMQKYYQERDLAAREWKEKGGKVVGYFCDSVPDEMIFAAGLFPLRISGDPLGGTEEIDKYLEPVYEGFVHSHLDMLLTGKYDFVDFMIIPRSRDSISQQYANLCQIQALDPDLKLPSLYSFEFTHTQTYTSGFYTLERIRGLRKKLEEWAGKEISDESLSEAIAITNESRVLLKKVAALRAAEPPRISGVEALQIIGSSMFMLKKDHNNLLREFLKTADQLPSKEGARLFVEASPLDNLQFYELVESCNATIVAEDNCWGNRYFDGLIDTSIDPVEAIAKRYHQKSPCPYIYYPADLRTEYCLKKAMESKAQGVIFYIFEHDSGQIWDYPTQNKALEKKGIPAICFAGEKYLLSDPDRLKKSIEEFIEDI
ncbi:2-hydroxyacyl-CoA dehydratase subunit D [Thermodesulfobacteriota bacterium]